MHFDLTFLFIFLNYFELCSLTTILFLFFKRQQLLKKKKTQRSSVGRKYTFFHLWFSVYDLCNAICQLHKQSEFSKQFQKIYRTPKCLNCLCHNNRRIPAQYLNMWGKNKIPLLRPPQEGVWILCPQSLHFSCDPRPLTLTKLTH